MKSRSRIILSSSFVTQQLRCMSRGTASITCTLVASVSNRTARDLVRLVLEFSAPMERMLSISTSSCSGEMDRCMRSMDRVYELLLVRTCDAEIINKNMPSCGRYPERI